MAELPSGTVTFLFTDIEGSTKILQQLGSDYAEVLAGQRNLLRATFQKWNGREVDVQGDASFAAFPRAADAVRAALEAQRDLGTHSWPQGLRVRVRMGLHTGEPALTSTGYVGIDVHTAARICDAGHGGQVLVSPTTRDLVKNALPDGVTLRDLGQHRLKDLSRPTNLFQLVASGLESEFPPLKSLEGLPNNLPVQVTSFIGREREMVEVKRLLLETRLLTLVGVGGAGKTRLALQVAAEVSDSYPDGVWLIELASLSDPALLPQTVATTLGVHEEGGRPILNTLTDYLRAKDLLLMLDNCEHLIGACAGFTDLMLHTCPHARLLATSREGLEIEGETTWRVPSLSLPGAAPATAENLAEYEAVRLFVDRARYVFPGFELTNRNAPVVAQVCRRLDGIPLAIELAAARVKVLSVEQIAERLDDRFRLLTGGSRTALPRQQTLRALIDWSYDLLSDAERVLFRRLSVFAGGCTLEAVEAVCGEDQEARRGDGEKRGHGDAEGRGRGDAGTVRVSVSRADVLDLLAHLVDKSLVLVERQTADTRYRMLETIRQYARENLMDSGEGEQVRDRHAHFYLALIEKSEFELRGPEQAAWMNRIEAEHDNLRSALEWTVGRDDGELALRLVAAFSQFWQRRDRYSEAREWSERALARASGPRRSRARVRALNLLASIALFQGNYQAGKSCAEESLALARELEDWSDLGEAENSLGMLAWHHNDYVLARGHFEQSLAIFQRIGDRSGSADSLHFLGHTASDQGDYMSAHSLFSDSLRLLRGLGDKLMQGTLIGDLGLLAYLQSDLENSGSLLEESLALAREVNDEDGVGQGLQRLGDLARCKGEYKQAATLYNQSLELFEQTGAQSVVPSLLHSLGYVAQHESDYGRAAALFSESLRSFREQSDKKGIVECIEGLAGVAGGQGHWEKAARLLGAAEALRQALGATLWPADLVEHDRNIASVRAQLSEQEFSKGWAEGRTLTMEQAIGLAVSNE